MAHREQFHFLEDIFPQAGPELLRLLQGGAENAMLLRSDFYAVRDYLDIGSCRTDDVPAAILLLLMIALEEGSLCIESAESTLLRRLADLVPEAEAATWARRMVHALEEPGYPGLIGTAPADDRLIIAHAVGPRRFLYFQKHLRAELAFQHDLSRRLAESSTSGAGTWSDIVPQVLNAQTFRLDADQQTALLSALTNNLTIISGGPGTGKTSIVLTLLRCLVRGGYAPERIALAAPTGRAAQRVTDAVRTGLDRLQPEPGSPDHALRDLAASTLHQLLSYSPTRNIFRRHRENPIAADVVIVDEVSMVGLVLMAQLLQALEPSAKLILLGDKNQLPSVDAGAVLAQLVSAAESTPDGRLQNRVMLLRTNHRSQQQIAAAADDINRQDAGIVDRLPSIALSRDMNLDHQAGCFLLEQSLGTPQELRGFLQIWADQAYFHDPTGGATLADLVDAIEFNDQPDTADAGRLARLFALMDRFRLLTLVRDGAWGCDEINEFLQYYLRPRLHSDPRGSLFAGVPVLVTRNDPARGLFNGDVGMTLRTRGGGIRVAFPRYGGAVSFPAESLPAHELGFALTVHKSQGSEYRNVMVVVPPKGGKRLLTKELIYTAITRAKSFAVICAAKDVLKFAISRRIVRESGVLAY